MSSTGDLFDVKQGLAAELASAKQMQEAIPSSIGIFKVERANKTIQDSSLLPDPKPLWREIWYEGEVHCLFSDSNLGKSICGIQIATEIAKEQIVVFFDGELSEKQFEKRYKNAEAKEWYTFPDNLIRITIDRAKIPVENVDGVIIESLKSVLESTGAKVLVIDNLTWLCGDSEKGYKAVLFMKKLLDLKFLFNASVLVLAHTPKRNQYQLLTKNDLAGSRNLFNFFDSVSAIGISAKDDNLRYIKQLKVREGEFTYTSKNILICQIAKDGAWLHFKELGLGNEYEHLKHGEQTDENELQRNVNALKDAGYSQRKIAEQLGVNVTKVNRVLNKQ